MKKIISIVLSFVLVLGTFSLSFAADVSKLEEYTKLFVQGEGPEVNSLKVDYLSFTPTVQEGKKYPLVIYFHGMGQGGKPGKQLTKENNFALWASEELQSRFTNGGAFLFVPRSHEERKEYWSDEYTYSVKAAVDEFIEQNRESVDLTRIYVGGFSMGGKMTLKMVTSYPDFFAAAFPMCPAYAPGDEQFKAISNLPVWLIVSRFDAIAGYYAFSKDVWEGICDNTNIPSDCRLSLFGTVCFPNGRKTPSNHHVWYAVANDLFTYDEGDYPNMKTTDATGKEIKLTSPDGLISWLCSHTSNYNGQELENTGLCEKNPENTMDMASRSIKALFYIIADAFKSLFK